MTDTDWKAIWENPEAYWSQSPWGQIRWGHNPWVQNPWGNNFYVDLLKNINAIPLNRHYRAGPPQLEISETQGEAIDQETNERTSPYELLRHFVDPGLFAERMTNLFIKPKEVQWSLVLDAGEGASVGEYAAFFAALDNLYSLMLTLQIDEYFVQKWIRGVEPRFSRQHRLIVRSISKASPDDIKVTAVEGGLKAVGDALSIGKQYQDIRTAGAKVQEAKAQARKVELEVAALEREERLADATEPEDVALLKAKKSAEFRALRRQEEEEELKMQKLRRQNFAESLELLEKAVPVFEKLPEALRAQFVHQMSLQVAVVQESPLEIKAYEELPPPADNKRHRDARTDPS